MKSGILHPPHSIRRGTLNIANEYLQGGIDYYDAAVRLGEYHHPFSSYVTGELAYDQAWSADSNQVTPLLEEATEHLDSVANFGLDHEKYDPRSALLAEMRLAQIKSTRIMLLENRLPGSDTVTEMYDRLRKVGKKYLELSVPGLDSKRHEVQNIILGSLGELAVLGLAQRYSLGPIGCDTWLPLHSTFREDHGGDCQIVTDQPAWDISVFTQYDEDPMVNSYQLQVKTKKDRHIRHVSSPTLIIIGSDLTTHKSEREPVKDILLELYHDDDPEIDQTRIKANLAIRTDALLEIIDQ